MKVLNYTNVSLIILCSLSCSLNSRQQLSPIDMVSWFNKERGNFMHEKTIGEYIFKLQFVPAEIQVLSEVGDPSAIEKKYYDQRLKELKGNIFCYFEITPVDNTKTLLETNAETPTDYGERLNYFISHAQKDFFILQGKDSLKCQSYHFENTYGLKKSNTIALLFENKDSDADLEFVFDDKVLNTGPVRFIQESFKKAETPAIKFN